MKSTDNGNTWGSPIMVGTSFTSTTAVSGPVVELANGDLIMAVYGRNVNDPNYYSVHSLKSTDGGNTWGSEATIGNGIADSLYYAEPNLVLLPNGNLLALIRDVTTGSKIYSSISTDSGATWSAPTVAFNGTGAPRVILLHSGNLLAVYRSYGGANSTKGVAYRISTDNGATWTSDAQEAYLDIATYLMDYASPFEVANGWVAVAYGDAAGSTNGDIRIKYLAEGGGASPLGSVIGKGLASSDGLFVVGDAQFFTTSTSINTSLLTVHTTSYSTTSADNLAYIDSKVPIYIENYSSDDGLVLYLPFSEGMTSSTSITAYDRSPYGNDGTASGMPMNLNSAPTSTDSGWSTTTCKTGTCMAFDGVNDSISVSNVSNLRTETFSGELWIKRNGLPATYSHPISNYGANGGAAAGWDLYLFGSTNAVKLNMQPGNQYFSFGDLPDQTWTNLAFTYNADTDALRLYMNGQLVLDTTFADFIPTSYVGGGGSNLAIGRASWYAGEYFHGTLDEVKIFNKALKCQLPLF